MRHICIKGSHVIHESWIEVNLVVFVAFHMFSIIMYIRIAYRRDLKKKGVSSVTSEQYKASCILDLLRLPCQNALLVRRHQIQRTEAAISCHVTLDRLAVIVHLRHADFANSAIPASDATMTQ